MAVKSFREIATSLSGSAFRRIIYDGRTQMLRQIPTLGHSGRRCTRPVQPARRSPQPAR